MSEEGALARLGFTFSEEDDELSLTQEFEVAKDVEVGGDTYVGKDVAVTGNVRVAGKITSVDTYYYSITGVLYNLNANNNLVAVVLPQGFTGYLLRVCVVLLGNVVDAGNLRIDINGTADATYDIGIGGAAVAGDVFSSPNIPDYVGYVEGGDYIDLYVQDDVGAAINAAVTFNFVRT